MPPPFVSYKSCQTTSKKSFGIYYKDVRNLPELALSYAMGAESVDLRLEWVVTFEHRESSLRGWDGTVATNQDSILYQLLRRRFGTRQVPTYNIKSECQRDSRRPARVTCLECS